MFNCEIQALCILSIRFKIRLFFFNYFMIKQLAAKFMKCHLCETLMYMKLLSRTFFVYYLDPFLLQNCEIRIYFSKLKWTVVASPASSQWKLTVHYFLSLLPIANPAVKDFQCIFLRIIFFFIFSSEVFPQKKRWFKRCHNIIILLL